MSCYRPMYGAYQGLNDAGKPSYKILGAGAKWDGHPMYHPKDIGIPCGHCIGCRLDKSRQWADRMMLELDHSKTAVFVTLTYDNDHVPIGMIDPNGVPVYTLCKRDVQLWLKRLRKYLPDKHIRYYIAGEYGPKTLRPHYHGIIFGLDLSDIFGLVQYGKNAFGQNYYTSPWFEKLWKCGYVSIAPVSWQTCAYVSRYVTKKLSGDAAGYYAANNIEPEFAVMSLKPGIGGYFAVDHPELLGKTYQYIDDPNGVRHVNKVATPKYLLSKLEQVNPELYEQICANRKRYAQDKNLSELHLTDLDFCEYNIVKERDKERSFNALTRDKI